MKLENLSYVFAMVTISQIIVNCGQNTQTPEYNANPGSNAKSRYANQSDNLPTMKNYNPSPSRASADQMAGTRNTVQASVSGTLAQANQQTQSAASSSNNLPKIISVLENVLNGVKIQTPTKSNQTANYSAAFNSNNSIDPSLAYNSNLDLGINTPSSYKFPDYSSKLNSGSTIDPSIAFSSNIDLDFNSPAVGVSTTSSNQNCRAPTRAPIIQNNC